WISDISGAFSGARARIFATRLPVFSAPCRRRSDSLSRSHEYQATIPLKSDVGRSEFVPEQVCPNAQRRTLTPSTADFDFDPNTEQRTPNIERPTPSHASRTRRDDATARGRFARRNCADRNGAPPP